MMMFKSKCIQYLFLSVSFGAITIYLTPLLFTNNSATLTLGWSISFILCIGALTGLSRHIPFSKHHKH
jgi:hypothetical protein